MAILINIRKLRETDTTVEYEVIGESAPPGTTLVIDKLDHEKTYAELDHPTLRRAVVIAYRGYRRDGQWPQHGSQQS